MRMKKTVRCKTTKSVQMRKTKATVRYKTWGAEMKKNMTLIWWPKDLRMFDCYNLIAEILRQHAQNSQDPSINKAMMIMMATTKNMN